jgi:hypothetical protein
LPFEETKSLMLSLRLPLLEVVSSLIFTSLLSTNRQREGRRPNSKLFKCQGKNRVFLFRYYLL